MKRFFLSIIMVVIGLSAFSQSPSISIDMRPAFPLVVCEGTDDVVTLSNNDINLYDIILDSLPQYEIGHIFEQTVRYSYWGHGFFLKADSLHSLNVVYSYEIDEQPNGSIRFDETTGLFKYYPAIDDYKPFVVKFTATNGTESITEDVEFNLMPQIPFEADVFHAKGQLPDAGDYTIIAETSKSMYLNNETRTARSVSISGKDVIFDDAVQNKVWGLSGCDDIYELNIYAERLIIRSALSFPQTDITIYAKELIFEDKGNGIIASINTTPRQELTLADGDGVGGNNAGNITLNIKSIKANAAKRLLLHGTNGQSTNRNGTPGNGGNGGIVSSTIDVCNYCDYVRGRGGVKYDVASDGSSTTGPAIANGEMGRNGRFMLINQPYAYLHPYYISAVMRYANDAFINNYTDEVLQTCKEYRAIIDDYLSVNSQSASDYNHEGIIDVIENLFVDVKAHRKTNEITDLFYDDDEVVENKLGLQNELLEINSMLVKLEQGLDYFGNPDGWVPLLSFEVYLETYNKEIDRAIPTLYMYYWLNRIDQTLQNQVKASEFAANLTEQEIDDNVAALNALILEVPVLQDEVTAMTAMIETLTVRIEKLQQQLLARAIKKVKKRNLLSRIFGIGKVVATVLPVIGPVGQAIGATLNVISSAAITGLQLDLGTSIKEVANEYVKNKESLEQDFNDLSSKKGDEWRKTYSRIMNDAVSPLISGIDNVYNIISNTTVSNSKVQAEFDKLRANSAEWNMLKNQIDELNAKKTELINHVNQVFTDMATTMSDISNGALALDAFRNDAFTGNSKRDLNALLYFERMSQEAECRLLKYHYYLRKAYEYRMLKPYGGREFSLVNLYKRAEQMGMSVDSVINENSYNTLGSVFRNDISDMTARIIDEYTYNAAEQTTSIEVEIPDDQLAAINKGESVTLNFHDMGHFAPNEENIRVINLSVVDMKTHVVGNVGSAGQLTLNMEHRGISQFRKEGQVYWFNHISRNTTHHHTWGVKYKPVTNEIEAIQPSAASTSLLSSLLNYNTDKIMLFSRPSAWGDITLSRTQHQANVVIDKLRVKLEYDYTQRPSRNRNINIMANEGLLPYIACSEPDISGRSDGMGHLYRSYTASSQNVKFTAVEKYGAYRFKNWTDDCDNVVSDKADLTINRNADQTYIANYELYSPVINVPDTIKLGHNGGEWTVSVRNAGIGDQEMEWYVSDSLSHWVHLNGEAEGIDDGSFKFTYDENPEKKYRIDSLEIFAPEAYQMVKKIYIVQMNDPDTDVRTLDNVTYMNQVIASSGSQTKLSVRMKNSVPIRGFQFDLYLPEGVTVVKSAKGKIQGALSAGRLPEDDEHTLTFSEQPDGAIRFLCSSQYNETFKGNDGEVATLLVNIANGMEYGDYPINMKNIKLTETNISKFYETERVKSTLTVTSYILGDINNDGEVDVSDYTGVANRIHGKTPVGFNELAGDVDESGGIDILDYTGIANIIHTGSIYGNDDNASVKMFSPRWANTDLSGYGNVMYISPFAAEAGQQIDISIRMKNTAEIRGFQFDLYLPAGMTVVKSSNGRMQGSLSHGRLPDDDEHKLTFSQQPDGAIRFLCSSEYEETFTGNDGEIATLRVNVAADMADGSYPILLRKMKLTENDIRNFYSTDQIETTVVIGVDPATGINGLASGGSSKDAEVYDLAGRKVAKVTKNGVYIVSGQKLLKR